jgi:hypothetical protein
MMYNITNEDYTFAENEGSEDWAIRLKGKYDGVLYQYGKVQARINEIVDNGDGEATLSFKYAVIDSNGHDKEELEDSEEFNNYIGAVLQHIITDAFDTGKYKIGENATDNTDNSTTQSSD